MVFGFDLGNPHYMSGSDFGEPDKILTIFLDGYDRIIIARNTISGYLFRSEFLYLFDLEFQFLCLFKFQFFGFFLHLSSKFFDDRKAFSRKKLFQRGDIISIYFYFFFLKQAWCRAESDRVIEAGNTFSCPVSYGNIPVFFHKFHMTASNSKSTSEYFENLRHIRPGGIGAKIYSKILFIAGFYHFRDRSGSYVNIGEIFPVFHENIVLWLFFFDKVYLQYECFQFISRLYNLNVPHLSNHGLFCKIQSFLIAPVRTYSGVKIHRFPHVNNGSSPIFHAIYPRRKRESGNNFYYVRRGFHWNNLM
ncbi:MAG: hypothetical protein ACD_78C00341G0001 [uncultured bacterium (gcode 4)]|uniref:Uncharacterized protein n=1 Tax=uncultured bacterium (gcode 4) TaxID=1234023 RepID=K1XH38_9BACT|nr:MAG: hypothetical protein ACD_78C00341G0001 [uncultured bacterium (gcode 4)]